MLGGIVRRALVERLKGGVFSLRAHLIAFGIAILVPASVWQAMGLSGWRAP